VVRARLHDEAPRLPVAFLAGARFANVIVVDSAERLPRWQRRLLLAASAGRGLLLTTHTPSILAQRLPLVGTPEALDAILRHLLGEDADRLRLRPAEQLARAKGSIRQALFDLYDDFERDEAFGPDRC